jgi:hypothetical protein
MDIREHHGYGHGLRPGTTRDINCPSCRRENEYREIFAPAPPAITVNRRWFYTIVPADVGKRFIDTTEGKIPVGDILGAVQKEDVGRRLYHVPADSDVNPWIWQCEDNFQRTARQARGTS